VTSQVKRLINIATTLSVVLGSLWWQVSPAAEAAADQRFDRLQVQFEKYRDLAIAGGWPEIPDGPTIRPGDPDPRVPVLAKRLAVTGDLADTLVEDSAADYGEELQNAVRRFQSRHGLEEDGLVGPRTLRALNVSVNQRIEQIEINLQRIRRIFANPEGDFVLVNVAAFRAFFFRDGRQVFETNVIVGDTENQTPIFDSRLQYIVINPTWTVPRSIAVKEMLAKIQSDEGYLEKGNYRVFDPDGNAVELADIDWSALTKNNFPYTLVQSPGPHNELGRVKFMFPNEHSVCMHDTPGKASFDYAARALSHGCIRVEEPIEFAELMLQREGWTRENIVEQMESGETRTVVLAKAVPILLHYWTAEADEQGTMYFYEDVYQRDAVVSEALDY